MTTARYYVYALFRDNGTPFYIGKGCRCRWAFHEFYARHGRKGHRYSIIRDMLASGIEVPKVKLHEGLSEALAHQYEVALIAAIGRKPLGPLVNETDGGEGSSGYKMPPERVRRGFTIPPDVRAKISTARLGTKRSPGVTEKISAKIRGTKQTPERIEKRVSKIRGRKYSEDHVAKMAESLRGRKLSRDHLSKTQAVLRAIENDPMKRAKREQARREALGKPEVRERNSARVRAMWADPTMRELILARQRDAHARRYGQAMIE